MTKQDNAVRPFQIVADKGCNLPPWLIRRFGIHLFPQDNIYSIEEDILFMASSDAVGNYRHMIQSAYDDLSARNPNRDYKIVDSLCVGLGFGRLLMGACELREDQVSLEETYQWARDNRLRVCHWFLTTEAAGLLPDAAGDEDAPVLVHVDDSGAFAPRTDKVASLDGLLTIFKNTAHKPYNKHSVSITHASNEAAALELADLLANQCEVTNPMIYHMEEVLTAKLGTGAVGLLFWGDQR